MYVTNLRVTADCKSNAMLELFDCKNDPHLAKQKSMIANFQKVCSGNQAKCFDSVLQISHEMDKGGVRPARQIFYETRNPCLHMETDLSARCARVTFTCMCAHRCAARRATSATCRTSLMSMSRQPVRRNVPKSSTPFVSAVDGLHLLQAYMFQLRIPLLRR
jgi:hypothetical protein